MALPLILAAVAGTGFGAFFGSQVDDAVEVVTGEKDGINVLFLAVLIAGAAYFYFKVIKA